MTTQNRNYKIMPYDPKWPKLFTEESSKIRKLIGDNISEIYHIGSTSVPGMSGKATIDMLLVVDDISKINDQIADLEKIGYKSRGARNSKNSHLFEKEINGNRIFILHFYQKGGPEISQMIAIRDNLRKYRVKADEYSKYKLDLVKEFPNDYGQYRKHKDKYMEKFIKEIE